MLMPARRLNVSALLCVRLVQGQELQGLWENIPLKNMKEIADKGTNYQISQYLCLKDEMYILCSH